MRTTVRTSQRTSVSVGCFGTLLIGLFIAAIIAYAVEVLAVAAAVVIVVLLAAAIIRRIRKAAR